MLKNIACLLALWIPMCQCASPSYISEPYIMVVENLPNDTVICNFSASDSDVGDEILVRSGNAFTQEMTYLNYTPGNFIAVDVLPNKPFDREQTEYFDIRYILSDRQFNEIPFSIRVYVLDLNDNSPKFTRPHYSWDISEHDKNENNNFTEIKAADPDSGINGTSGEIYEMKPNTQSQSAAIDYNNAFSINPKNGIVHRNTSVELDYETNNFYQFTIFAFDRNNDTGSQNGSADFIIRILDAQDTPPFFIGVPYRTSISENRPKNERVIQITARDGDTGIPNPLDYSIVDGDCSSYFNISNDGEIRTVDPIDREKILNEGMFDVCTLTILVQENDKNANKQYGSTNATTSVTITIIDENDNPPMFANTTLKGEILENTPNYVPLMLDDFSFLYVYDPDASENATMNLSLWYNDSHPCLDFDIKPRTITKGGLAMLLVKNNTILDRETVSIITFLIIATETRNNSHKATATVTLSITDVNDNNPQFNYTNYSFNISENAENGTSVANVTASDRDLCIEQGKCISYLIAGGMNRFIVGTYTGEITTNCKNCTKELDREDNAVYYIIYTAIDEGGRSNSTYITIHLTDENDNPPIFQPATFSGVISKIASVGSTVTQITAIDNDEKSTNNSKISYFFGNNTSPPHLFKIDRDTGIISVNNSLINYSCCSFILIVVAEDHGEPKINNSAIVNITVLDVNINKPVIVNIPENKRLEIYECARNETEIFSFNYSDADHGINAVADFNITDADIDFFKSFKLYPNGSLFKVSKLNANKNPNFQFKIYVTDRGTPALSSEKELITLHVIDVNDHPPEFTNKLEQLEVEENMPAGTSVGFVTATDKDANLSACYTIKDETLLGYFNISRSNGLVTTTAGLDYEYKAAVNLTVHVEDCSVNETYSNCDAVSSAAAAGQSNVNVMITVLDVNDNAPIFLSKEITIGMRRITEANTVLDISLKSIGYVTDRDSDQNGRTNWVFKNNGTIRLSSGLEIDPLSGQSGCEDGRKHIMCVMGNGTLKNNKYYSQDLSGYFDIPVSVMDSGGSDTAIIKVYLIGDSQILVMTLLGTKEDVSRNRDTILQLYSNATRYKFVYDWIDDHKTSDGRIESFKTDLYFHLVEPSTHRILSADEALRVVDNNYEALTTTMQHYNVLQIVSNVKTTPEVNNEAKTIYILIAVIAVLTLSVAVIIYASLSVRRTYQHKLKAATFKSLDLGVQAKGNDLSIPGSNMYCKLSNPLLNADIPDTKKRIFDTVSVGSHNSLDTNSIGIPKHDDVYEEIGKTLDLYTEDVHAYKSDTLLEEALRQHNMKNAHEQKENHNTDGVVLFGEDVLEFENSAYIDDNEGTEI